MLTGDETMTNGTAYLDGLNIRTDMPRVRQRIGYCPQFDGLIELMTGKELLTMYARLRGVPEPEIASLVAELAESLMLEKHINKPCGTYSGGNKRKLSTAVALCGPSPVVYLDEPTTGTWGVLSFYFPFTFLLLFLVKGAVEICQPGVPVHTWHLSDAFPFLFRYGPRRAAVFVERLA